MRTKYMVLSVLHIVVLVALSTLMFGAVLNFWEDGLNATATILFLLCSVAWVAIYLSYRKCRKKTQRHESSQDAGSK